uniref:FMN-binding glutamate synthase family protein n=1 Tax=Methanobrevibacter sp. TaxID=66852 RepID=UPI00386D3660
TEIEGSELAYDKNYAKSDKDIRQMDAIHQMAISGKSIVEAMYTEFPMPNWDDILILGCQLNPQPLEGDVEVNTQTIIGKTADKPLVIESPIYITHMSFGALSRETKIALAKGSAAIKTAQCSGEGGILVEEMENAYKYIFEYVPNKYSVTEDNLRNADAIEIKIGQSTKPGLGGQLQGEKVTSEIADVRGKPIGEDIHSPATIPGISTKEDLKELVDDLRARSDGRPIGIKFAAGRIEDDLEHILYANPDFITIDGRGGSTGASPKLIRDSTSVPTIYALSRARKFLDEHESDITLTITGGLRVSSDFAKALAMGADAIAIGTGAMIAAACQQYRICDTGDCPVGVATQDEELRKRLKIESASKRVENYLKVSTEELKTFARITGHVDVHDLNINDLCTINSEISDYTDIKHV